MRNFVTHGLFLALMLIIPPWVSHHLKGNLSRSLINQPPRLCNLKYAEVMVPCSKHSITMVLISVKLNFRKKFYIQLMRHSFRYVYLHLCWQLDKSYDLSSQCHFNNKQVTQWQKEDFQGSTNLIEKEWNSACLTEVECFYPDYSW